MPAVAGSLQPHYMCTFIIYPPKMPAVAGVEFFDTCLEIIIYPPKMPAVAGCIVLYRSV